MAYMEQIIEPNEVYEQMDDYVFVILLNSQVIVKVVNKKTKLSTLFDYKDIENYKKSFSEKTYIFICCAVCDFKKKYKGKTSSISEDAETLTGLLKESFGFLEYFNSEQCFKLFEHAELFLESIRLLMMKIVSAKNIHPDNCKHILMNVSKIQHIDDLSSSMLSNANIKETVIHFIFNQKHTFNKHAVLNRFANNENINNLFDVFVKYIKLNKKTIIENYTGYDIFETLLNNKYLGRDNLIKAIRLYIKFSNHTNNNWEKNRIVNEYTQTYLRTTLTPYLLEKMCKSLKQEIDFAFLLTTINATNLNEQTLLYMLEDPLRTKYILPMLKYCKLTDNVLQRIQTILETENTDDLDQDSVFAINNNDQLCRFNKQTNNWKTLNKTSGKRS